jgi:hypothetical protein|nr:MAG TPA: hypothetical protein [Caudoviricetes sp.]
MVSDDLKEMKKMLENEIIDTGEVADLKAHCRQLKLDISMFIEEGNYGAASQLSQDLQDCEARINALRSGEY